MGAQGAKGDSGATGPQGPQGPAGADGRNAASGGITGRLESCDGSSLTGYLVHIPGRAFSVYTGADGAFDLGAIPTGTYDLSVERNGVVGATVTGIAIDATVYALPQDVHVGGACTGTTCGNTITSCGPAGACVTCPQVANGTPICTGTACGVACNPGFQSNGAGACVPVLLCTPGSTRSCYTGPGPTNGVGACHAGVETCLPGGLAYSACTGQVVPAAEVCDGLDNNCNGVVDDGGVCNTVQSCGAFGISCNVPNGTPACISGQCAVSTCGFGFANCDGSVLNGCETNINASVNNCGACGVVCGSGICSNGVCQPPPSISSFQANVTTVTANSPVQLVAVYNGGTATVSAGGVNVGTFSQSATSLFVTPPLGTTTYTLTVANAAGLSTTSTVTITAVAPPVINAFFANPPTVAPGQMTVVQGQFTGGTAQLGVTDSSGFHGSVAVSSFENTRRTLSETSTFTLTVTNVVGTSVSQQVVVIVQ